MPDAVIIDAIRTPIGRAMKGSLKSVRADELAAMEEAKNPVLTGHRGLCTTSTSRWG